MYFHYIVIIFPHACSKEDSPSKLKSMNLIFLCANGQISIGLHGAFGLGELKVQKRVKSSKFFHGAVAT